ncbi:MAG: HAMP domain-containing histidine kinase [Oscillospiraceae bacterium]|nr:HAMP domain-containing histidine kinase [Oscillospiraceae bacterium]
MFLKHRNFTAWVLLLLAAVCWILGQEHIQGVSENGVAVTTYPSVYLDAAPATVYATAADTEPAEETANIAPSEPGMEDPSPAERSGRFLGFILCFAAAALGVAGVFVFWQEVPLLGPDGVSMLMGIGGTVYSALMSMDYILWSSTLSMITTYAGIIIGFCILFSLRELWGWIRAKYAMSWCLAHRIAGRCPKPQLALLVYVGWVLLAGYHLIWLARYQMLYDIPFWGFVITGVFGFLCLWKYGKDLEHFQKQLDRYQQGLPITVGDGAFGQTEAQLLDVQAQHEEAVRTAVTSERFKVELISNVSHDLRTPLTAILGYSELLQKESLSPEGQEQLRRLHLKAGYMNDLVEALFELTKVSSGAAPSKKDEIDLVRLLEQTIGLFDDQLAAAGLAVRRSYGSDAIPIITDGARMHQVFANLLGNAIKYALAGTRIYLEVRETESSYLVRMMNTASYEMDFKPDEIMQRFARGDKARSTQGSGLGLAIAQTYTESVGGSFRVSVDGDQFSAIVELPKTERNL